MEAEIIVGRAEWYRSLLSDLKELVENEKLTLLRTSTRWATGY